MGKQSRVYDLLTKKQSLAVFATQKRKSKLSEELNKTISYQEQLLNMLNAITDPEMQKTVAQVKSEAWYNLKIQDELIAVKNKIDFLSIEIKNQNMQIALASDKHKKYEAKKNHFSKLDLIEKENRLDAFIPSTNKSRSKF